MQSKAEREAKESVATTKRLHEKEVEMLAAEHESEIIANNKKHKNDLAAAAKKCMNEIAVKDKDLQVCPNYLFNLSILMFIALNISKYVAK